MMAGLRSGRRGEEPEDYLTQTITCEGEAVEVDEIGGGWTWYRVKFPETEDDDPLGQKANEKSFLFLSSDFRDHPAAMECQSGRRLTRSRPQFTARLWVPNPAGFS